VIPCGMLAPIKLRLATNSYTPTTLLSVLTVPRAGQTRGRVRRAVDIVVGERVSRRQLSPTHCDMCPSTPLSTLPVHSNRPASVALLISSLITSTLLNMSTVSLVNASATAARVNVNGRCQKFQQHVPCTPSHLHVCISLFTYGIF